MINTERLNIVPLTDDEMLDIISREIDEEMKEAYKEMYNGCKEFPDMRPWYVVWEIRLKETGKRVGDMCFKGLEDGMVEIGYGVDKAFEGNGYATEAVIGLCKWAFSQNSVERVEAETDPDNKASQRVLERAGFVSNGVMGEEGPRFVLKL